MNRDYAHLDDILKAARAIAEHVRGMDEEAFLADPKTRDAVLYELAILGEAVKRLSGELRQARPEIDWKSIAGLRDVVIHRYHRILAPQIWRIVIRDVPPLIPLIEAILPPEDEF